MAFLLDSNVLSESSKRAPEPRVIQWLSDHDAELYVSALSIGEMTKGIHLLDQGQRRQDIENWYRRIEHWAARRILPLDAEVMQTWGQFYAKYQRKGRKLPLMDSLLAATALHFNLTIVTRNTDDFPDDIPLLSPWIE